MIKLIDDIDEYYNKQSQLWLVLVCILSPCVLGIIIGAIICGKSDKNSGSDSSYNYHSGFTGGNCGGGGGGGATGGWQYIMLKYLTKSIKINKLKNK